SARAWARGGLASLRPAPREIVRQRGGRTVPLGGPGAPQARHGYAPRSVAGRRGDPSRNGAHLSPAPCAGRGPHELVDRLRPSVVAIVVELAVLNAPAQDQQVAELPRRERVRPAGARAAAKAVGHVVVRGAEPVAAACSPRGGGRCPTQVGRLHRISPGGTWPETTYSIQDACHGRQNPRLGVAKNIGRRSIGTSRASDALLLRDALGEGPGEIGADVRTLDLPVGRVL